MAMTTEANSAGTKVSMAEALRRARLSYDAGRLDDAEHYYRRILAAKADSAQALLGLSAVSHRRGRAEEALRFRRSAVSASATSAEALFYCGRSLADFGHLNEALAVVDRALALKPDQATALALRGTILARLGRREEALASLDRALAIDPDHADALIGRGKLFKQLERPAEARKMLERVLAKSPENIAALVTLGSVLSDLRRYEDAVDTYDQALAIAPGNVAALINRAFALRRLKRNREALATLDRATNLEHPPALHLRGNLLRDLGRFDEAVAVFDRLLRTDADNPSYLNNRSGALIEAGRHDEARPGLERALALEPEYAGATFNLGVTTLYRGDYSAGWRRLEARWKMEGGPRRRPFWKPLWLGDAPLAGKTILLCGEQGIGDTIQFIRYAPIVAKAAGAVIVEVQQGLKSLNWALDGVKQIVGHGDGWPAFDYYCPLPSLPAAFGTELATVPATIPYLKPTEAHLPKWRERLEGSAVRVGIAWSGNKAMRGDIRRSIRLRQLAPLFMLPGVDFVSLQVDADPDDIEVLRQFPKITHPAASWEETTAIV